MMVLKLPGRPCDDKAGEDLVALDLRDINVETGAHPFPWIQIEDVVGLQFESQWQVIEVVKNIEIQ